MKKALYAGSFDPITNGHLYVIRSGARLFEDGELRITLAINPEKKGTFSLDERLALIKGCVRDLPNVAVDICTDEYVVHHAREVGAGWLLRGIRNGQDHDYEHGLRHVNSDLVPEIDTIFIMPPRDVTEVSSSLVRGLIGPKNWEGVVSPYVPPNVYNALLIKRDGLWRAFQQTWQGLGAHGDPRPVFDELVLRYSEPHRKHHNWAHVAHVLHELKAVEGELNMPAEVQAAAFWHDAIYDPGAANNEEISAQLAQEALAGHGVAASHVKRVGDLVRSTDYHLTHNNTEDSDKSYLSDADWAITGQPGDRYDWYSMDIREEFSRISEDAFRTRRKAFLCETSAGTVFRTAHFRSKYESRAKDNFARELQRLGTGA